MNRQAGFTLLEAVLALLLAGMVVTGLAMFTGQWLGGWTRAGQAMRQAQALAAGVNRLAADIEVAAAVAGPAGDVLFEGTAAALALVRLPPDFLEDKRPGAVRIASAGTGEARVLLRSQAALAPGASGLAGLAFADPVALARWPHRVAFAYAGEDGAFAASWPAGPVLPALVRITVTDAVSGRELPMSTTVRIHAGTSVLCAQAKTAAICDAATAGARPR